MKRDLKRIEATLNRLEKPSRVELPHSAPIAPAQPQPTRSLSFEVVPKPQPVSPPAPGSDVLDFAKVPDLPSVASPGFTSHRNGANPALALNLLKEIEAIVSGWQTELQQALKQIQDLYLEGPIVDGWLESYSPASPEASPLRHADAACLMDYIDKTWGATSEGSPAAATGYRLCGLNEDGQRWFRHCPAEQIATVSLAIARYQKLRQLLDRKQILEARLGQLSETLIELHSELGKV